MIENGRISPLQLGVLFYLYVLGSAVLFLPTMVIGIARQDAWITLVFATIAALGVAFLYLRLMDLFPNETIVQYCERILGRVLGKLVAISYLWFYLFLSALVLRDTGDFLSTAILVQTPLDFTHFLFMIAVAYAVKSGLEVIARTGEVLIPWVLIMMFLMGILLYNRMEFSNLTPILPQGLLPVIKGIYPVLGFPIFEYVTFLMIFPFLTNRQKAKQAFYVGILSVGITGLFLFLLILTVLGPDITARSPFAIYEAAKQIRVGGFLERLESIVGGVWLITTFMKLNLTFYAANLAMAQIFQLKDYRALVFPFVIMVLALSILSSPNTAHLTWFAIEVWPVYAGIQGFLLPLILYIVARIRKV